MMDPTNTHVISHHLVIQPDEIKNIEKSTQDQGVNSYILYRPSPGENPQFVDMQPPSEQQDEPDYYTVKPRKTKKYSSTDDKQKKYLKGSNLKEKIVPDFDYDDQPLSSAEVTESPKAVNESDSAREEREAESKEEDENANSMETSAPASRLDFQMHGN